MKSRKRVDFSFGTKLRIIIAISILVPSLAGILGLSALMENSTINSLNKNGSLLLEQISFQLDSVLLNRLISSVDFLAGDETVKRADFSVSDYLEGAVQTPMIPSEVEKRIQMTFQNFMESNTNIAFVFLGLENGSYIETPTFKPDKPYDPRTRSWYIDTLEGSGEVKISDPYLTKVTQEMVVGVTKKITTYDRMKGVVGITVSLENIVRNLEAIKLDNGGKLIVLNSNGKIIYNALNPESVLKGIEELHYPYLEGLKGSEKTFESIDIDDVRYMRKSTHSSIYNWDIIALYPEEMIFKPIKDIARTLYLSIIFLVVFVLLITHFAATTVTHPILDLVSFVEFADDDEIILNKSLKKDLRRGDEIGLITRVLFKVILTLREMLGLSVHTLKALIDEGDFSDSDAHDNQDTGAGKLIQMALQKSRRQVTENVMTETLLEESRKALKLSEMRFRMAVQISNDAFWDYRVEQDAIYTNTRMMELADQRDNSSTKGIEGICSLLVSSDVGVFRTGLEKILAGQLNSFEGEFRIKQSNHEDRWVMAKIKLLSMTKSGKPSWIMGIFIDIHDRKQKEERLQGENLQLGVMVHERTQELLALNEELIALNMEMAENNESLNKEISDRVQVEVRLEKANSELKEAVDTIKNTTDQLIQSEKLSSLGILISGVAHEVNTPLGISVTLTSFVKQLQQELDQKIMDGNVDEDLWREFAQESGEALQLLHLNIERAAQLIQSFKNISADQYSEDVRSFNVLEYTNELLMSLQPVLKKTQIQIKLQCPTDLYLLSYPGAYSQILTNLIMNSIIHGFVSLGNGLITIDITRVLKGVRLIYTDDGVGIPVENRTKIFDPFFTTKRGKGNSGLGLYLVHSLVQQQFFGTIEFKPKDPNGSEFVLELREG